MRHDAGDRLCLLRTANLREGLQGGAAGRPQRDSVGGGHAPFRADQVARLRVCGRGSCLHCPEQRHMGRHIGAKEPWSANRTPPQWLLRSTLRECTKNFAQGQLAVAAFTSGAAKGVRGPGAGRVGHASLLGGRPGGARGSCAGCRGDIFGIWVWGPAPVFAPVGGPEAARPPRDAAAAPCLAAPPLHHNRRSGDCFLRRE